MADFRIALASRDAALNAIADAVDAGGSAGAFRIYSGAMPANADASPGGATLLATVTAAYPCGSVSGGVLSFTATAEAIASASGTATWARAVTASGDAVFDCDVGLGSATLNLNTTAIVAGGPVRVASFTISIPAS